MTTAPTNDTLDLAPRTTFDGPTLDFDFPGLQIGVAEYDEGPTGCTVLLFPAGAMTEIDIRGGAPGIVGNYDFCHAICLAGGSLYGLEAASGVTAELFARRDYSTHWNNFALVNGAIVYDYGQRKNAVYPDKALGRAAVRAARAGSFPLGARGAGRSVTVGNGIDFQSGESSGQGGAFRQVGATKIAVFSVVNAIGALVDRQGRVVRGHLNRETGQREEYAAALARRLAAGEAVAPTEGNTTLTVVVTNQRLTREALRQFGRQVHTSLARAIHPFHTVFDGDILFAVTTAEIDNEALPDIALGALASDLAWDAVLSCYQKD